MIPLLYPFSPPGAIVFSAKIGYNVEKPCKREGIKAMSPKNKAILQMLACPPLVCSLLGAVEPLLNPVWVFLFDGKAPGPFALMGGAVVIVSVTVWCIWQNNHPQPEKTVA